MKEHLLTPDIVASAVKREEHMREISSDEDRRRRDAIHELWRCRLWRLRQAFLASFGDAKVVTMHPGAAAYRRRIQNLEEALADEMRRDELGSVIAH